MRHLGMGATQREIDEKFGFEPEFEVVAQRGKCRIFDLVSIFEMKQDAIECADDFYAEHPDCAVSVLYENRFGTYNKVYEA